MVASSLVDQQLASIEGNGVIFLGGPAVSIEGNGVIFLGGPLKGMNGVIFLGGPAVGQH